MKDEDLFEYLNSTCDECAWYGDDYSINEYGEWVCNCEKCPCNEMTQDN